MSEQAHPGYLQTQNPEKERNTPDIETLFANIASQVPDEIYTLGTYQKEPYIVHDDPTLGRIGVRYWGNHQFLVRAWALEDDEFWVQKMFEYRFDDVHRANRLFALEDTPVEYAIPSESAITEMYDLMLKLHDGFHASRQEAHSNVIPLLGSAAQLDIQTGA
jgi:hypothetical protein